MTEFPEIDHDELLEAIADERVVLLDANGSDSFRQGHIPGAIDFAAERDRLAGRLPEDRQALIVAYCGGPMCNAYQAAAEAAAGLGYTNVKHYRPGISGWKAQQAPVESLTA